jgi:hypothetical protein
MTWTKKDLLLLDLINEFGKRYGCKQAAATFAALTKAKVKPPINEFGSYDPSTHVFRWRNDVNIVTLDMIRNHYMSVFGSDETIKKLFHPVVPLDGRYQSVIPYLMDILNAAFHVIRMQKGKESVYALVKINVHNFIDFDRFEQTLLVYRQYDAFSTRAVKKRTTKKRTTSRRRM